MNITSSCKTKTDVNIHITHLIINTANSDSKTVY
jgi:hypothetical protein